MGMMQTIATRALNAVGLERRSGITSGPWDRVFPATGGYSPRAAEGIAAVTACTGAIATGLASIPSNLYRRDSKGDRMEVTDHPLAAMMRTASNLAMTWPETMELWLRDTLMRGNGLLEIRADQRGQLSGLVYVPWGCVTVVYLSSGRLAYDVTDPMGRARNRRLLASEVIHLRDQSDDGLIGVSRLKRAAETVQAVAAANEFARSVTANGGYPSGVLSHPAKMDAAQKSDLRSQFTERHAGSSNAGRVLIVDSGMTFSAMQISPEDAELIETRRFGVEEICRIYQVPPPLVQDYSNNTFTNSETAGRWFAMFCLAPWARKIEAVISQALFPPGSGLELELDLSGFLRGDPATRWQSHKIAIETGVLDADEVRHIEGWNARKPKEAAL